MMELFERSDSFYGSNEPHPTTPIPSRNVICHPQRPIKSAALTYKVNSNRLTSPRYYAAQAFQTFTAFTA